MCGIAGFNLSRTERRINATDLATALLLGVEHRGRHATGAGYLDTDGRIMVQKKDVPASTFVHWLSVPADCRNAVLHTRWATQGSPKDNENNHPIMVPGVVGVHNGMVANDDELFQLVRSYNADAERYGQVDSEAIFAAIQHVEAEHYTEVLGLIEGSAAVAWIELARPGALHLARLNSSPLVVATTSRRSVVFASTEQAIRVACRKVGLTVDKVHYMPEGSYARVWRGEVMDRRTFVPAHRNRRAVPTPTETARRRHPTPDGLPRAYGTEAHPIGAGTATVGAVKRREVVDTVQTDEGEAKVYADGSVTIKLADGSTRYYSASELDYRQAN
jgi:glucosamine 6-phosphate synthetase-like amidotransferase/phosphosugar isomerase protein